VLLKKTDYLGTCENAGICHRVLEKMLTCMCFSAYMHISGTASLQTFRITNDKVMKKWNSLENPKTCSWWRQETTNSVVHCLA